jgi:hypothetical protein
MTTMQMTGAGTSALAWTDHDETHGSEWPPAARAELGTLPLSRLRRVTEHIRSTSIRTSRSRGSGPSST